MKRRSFFVLACSLWAVLVGGLVPAHASVSSQSTPLDAFSPERIDRPIDILVLKAIEPTTSPQGIFEFHLLVEAALGTIDLTRSGMFEYGVLLDYDEDARADYLLKSNYDATKQFFLDREDAELVNLITGEVECRGTLFSDVHLLDAGQGKLRVAYALTLNISKTCLPKASEVSIAAYGKNTQSQISDRVPDAGFVKIRQPWIPIDITVPKLSVQSAGSEVVVTAGGETGTFSLRDGISEVAIISFDDIIQAVVVPHRARGSLTIWRKTSGINQKVDFTATRDLLWFQNIDLGSVNPASFSTNQTSTLNFLARHLKPDLSGWSDRESKVTKFICTGIFGKGASPADKIMARQRAKTACELAERENPGSGISFWFQTKETRAPNYVGRVLVTVKGLEASVVSALGAD